MSDSENKVQLEMRLHCEALIESVRSFMGVLEAGALPAVVTTSLVDACDELELAVAEGDESRVRALVDELEGLAHIVGKLGKER